MFNALRCRTVLAVMLSALLAGAAQAQAPRDYLKGKLSFRYVAHPNVHPPEAPEIQDNNAIASATEGGAFWNNPSMASLHSLVKALLRDPSNGGDAELQRYAAAVVRMTDRPILIYLVDDKPARLDVEVTVGTDKFKPAERNWDVCVDEGGRAWPCAATLDGGAWGGFMSLGPVRTADAQEARETFLHELTHTQDKSDSRGHIFFVGGKDYRYGADEVHWDVEAMPNVAYTYAEGIADTIVLCYSWDKANRYFDWFADNGALWVEKPPPSPPASIVWLYDLIQKANPPVPELPKVQVPPEPSPTDPQAGAKREERNSIIQRNKSYAFYKVRSLPPNITMQNEFILALTLSQYAFYVDFDLFMEALTESNRRSTNVCSSALATLFEELASRTGTGNQRLVPLAFADYFTGFRAQNADQFALIFENALSRERWVDPYMAARPQVLAKVPVTDRTTPKWDDLTTIAMALGMKESRPGGPAQ